MSPSPRIVLLLAAGWTFLALGAARFSIVAGPFLVIALAPGVAGSAEAWLSRRAGGTAVQDADAPRPDPQMAAAAPRPDRPRVDVVLMPTGNPLSRWLDEADEWSVAYRDEQATIHLRDGSTACAGLAAGAQIR